MIRSVGDRVLVRPKPKPTHTKGGIELLATARVSEPVREGQVVSVGGRVTQVRKGDRVMWPTHEGDFADGAGGFELMSLHEAQLSLVLEK